MVFASLSAVFIAPKRRGSGVLGLIAPHWFSADSKTQQSVGAITNSNRAWDYDYVILEL